MNNLQREGGGCHYYGDFNGTMLPDFRRSYEWKLYNLAQSHVVSWLARIHGWFGKNGNARLRRFGITSVALDWSGSTRLVLRRCFLQEVPQSEKHRFIPAVPMLALVLPTGRRWIIGNPIICLRVRAFYSTTSRHAGQNIWHLKITRARPHCCQRAEKTLHGQSRCQGTGVC